MMTLLSDRLTRALRQLPVCLLLALSPVSPALYAAEDKPAPDKGKEAAKESGKDAGKDSAKETPKREEGAGDVGVLRQRLAERLSSKDAGKGDSVVRGTRPDAKKTAAQRPREEARPAAHRDVHWSYEGEGAPEHWAELKPEYGLCASGQRQSPIDIRDGIRVDLEKIQFDYRPSNFAVIDNGHTVEVDLAPGNSLQVMGRRYELLQFHFHRPSEERVNGRQFDMVAHLVHKDADGRLAVVAVLLERGRDQPVVQMVWNNLPLEKGEALQAQVQMDLNQLLPEDKSYYTYMGSLTTPPCSEGVLWMVMRQPVQLSLGQINIFSRLYPMNARPIQSGSGRLIKESSQ